MLSTSWQYWLRPHAPSNTHTHGSLVVRKCEREAQRNASTDVFCGGYWVALVAARAVNATPNNDCMARAVSRIERKKRAPNTCRICQRHSQARERKEPVAAIECIRKSCIDSIHGRTARAHTHSQRHTQANLLTHSLNSQLIRIQEIHIIFLFHLFHCGLLSYVYRFNCIWWTINWVCVFSMLFFSFRNPFALLSISFVCLFGRSTSLFCLSNRFDFTIAA